MPVDSTAFIGGTLSENWHGGVLAPNGCIYGIPGRSNSVLKIDPATDTVTTFGSVSATSGATIQNSYYDGELVGTDRHDCPPDRHPRLHVRGREPRRRHLGHQHQRRRRLHEPAVQRCAVGGGPPA